MRQKLAAKKKVRSLRLLVPLAFIIMIVLTGIIMPEVYGLGKDVNSPGGDDGNPGSPDQPGNDAPEDKPYQRTNILLLGIDAEGEVNRSDTIMLLSLGKENDDVSLLSIPRDSRVNIPGRGLDKINHAYAFGGSELIRETVEQFLDVPIHYSAQVDFVAFVEIVDLLGGVELYVEPAMVAERQRGFTKAGLQHLNGRQALEYVRFRHDSQGDIGRVQRQQNFLLTLAQEALQLSTIPEIPEILGVVDRHFKTDIPLTKMLSLANSLRKVNPETVKTGVIPGENKKIDGIWYWQVDNAAVEKLLTETLAIK